jgi:hypothetical protein
MSKGPRGWTVCRMDGTKQIALSPVIATRSGAETALELYRRRICPQCYLVSNVVDDRAAEGLFDKLDPAETSA